VGIQYTVEARADLLSIIDFGIDNDLPDPVSYVHQLRERFAHLATIKHPGRKGRVAGTTEWVVTGTPYIAVFTQQDTDIVIWRVLHGSQQWPSK
jgi:toxin ParE1/3/4